MTHFPITSLYAIPLAVLYLALYINVIQTRAKLGLAIGDGGNVDLQERIRRHGNFVETVPLIMILMLLAEANGTGQIWLYVAGAFLTLGRILHPFGLKATEPSNPLRIAGNSLGMLSVAILIVALVRPLTGL